MSYVKHIAEVSRGTPQWKWEGPRRQNILGKMAVNSSSVTRQG